MKIDFIKMQSTGNDFVIIDSSQISDANIDAEFVRKISHRHFGIGCDLVVFYKIHADQKSDISDIIDVRFFNSDGSAARFCGNAARCVGLLMKKTKNLSKCTMQVAYEEDLQTYDIQVYDDNSAAFRIEKCCSVKCVDAETVLEIEKSTIAALDIYNASVVDVGNPHLVLFVRNFPTLKLVEELGFFLELHPIFPNKVNVGFAKILPDDSIELTVLERGAGLTLSCGTGAYAAVCAACENGFLKHQRDFSFVVRQRGGDMQMRFFDDGSAMQSGSASFVFFGNIEI